MGETKNFTAFFIKQNIMSDTKKINGRLQIVPAKLRFGNVVAGTLSDEVATVGQLQDGTFNATFENLTVQGTLTASALTTDSVAPAITAKAGGGQDATLALSKNLNIVTTVATAADSVTLPAAAAGLRITVVNLGANALAVFPYTSDSINDAAANASVTQDPETTVTYNCYTGVLWQSDNESLDAFDKIYVGNGTVSLPSATFASDTDSGIYRIGANNIGIAANGAKVLDIATTGLTVTGATDTTTTLNIGTNQTFTKEVNHSISVSTTTTAATAGGNLTILGATGATSGAGGDVIVTGGTGGATAASVGGAITVTTGVSGAGGGASGVLSVKSGIGTTATGTATFGSGNASGGTSGTVTVTTGTGTTASGDFTSGTGNATTTSGNVTLSSGTGTTTGTVIVSTSNATTTAGALTISTGTASTTGGTITVSTGNISAGTSAAVAVTTGTGTSGTGAITFATGNASAGTAGNISFSPGTSSSTSVAPIVIVNGNEVTKPVAAPFFLIGTTASDAQFAKDIVGGYVEIRGATGNVQFPTGAMLTTAIGTVTSGTSFKCIFNAIGATPMTAGNTATVTANTNVVLDATADQDIATITGTSNVNIGTFQFTWDSANWIVSRL